MIEVLDRTRLKRTSCDLVLCCNCTKTMLVDNMVIVCPECGGQGTLRWARDEGEEEEIEYDNALNLLFKLGYEFKYKKEVK